MKKILVVDNDEVILRFMNDILTKEGHEVIIEKDGLSALDILKDFTPDVIFIDLIMPNIGGEKLCQIIRRTSELNDAFLVILSAIAAEAEIDIAQMGADTCIAKGPFDEMAQDILAALAQADLAPSQRKSRDLARIRSKSPHGIIKELLFVKRHFEIMLERMSEGILEIAVEKRIVYANPAALALINIPEDKLLASNFVDIFDENGRQQICELLNLMNSKPKAITYESPVNLNEHQVTVEILPIGEDVLPALVILNDVTERKRSEGALRKAHDELEERVKERTLTLAKVNDDLKLEIEKYQRAEEALRGSEKRYRDLFNSITDLIMIHDLEGRLLNVNSSVSKISGYTYDEMIGRPISDFINPKFRHLFREQYLMEIKEQGHSEGVAIFQTKEGTDHYIEYRNVLVKEEGRDPFVSGSGRDITKSLRAERELRISEERFRVLIEKSPFAISIIEEDGRYKYINPKFVELFGYTLEDVPTGREWFTKAYPDKDYRKQVISTWVNDQKEFNVGEVRPRTFNVTCKDSSEKVVYFRPVTMETGDKFVIHEDITERKRLEAQLRHAHKMESMGTIASGVAHNFRNVMSGILLDSQLIQMNMYKDEAKLKEIANRIGNAVERGSRLVNELMQFSSKQARDEYQPVNLTEVIQEVYELINQSFDKKIHIVMRIPQSLPTRGDYASLSQVFMNLCTNARDAMPDGGELRIEAKKAGDNAMVIISDTGHGMDDNTLERCFDPFFTTKEVDKGTGLGLFTTYGTVKEHGGDIYVFSEPNNGTTFKLYFPFAVAEKLDKEEGPPEIVCGTDQKILVVDDEMHIIESIKEVLEALGYRVTAVTNGKKAILEYQSWRPHVVLLDRNMPEMDGITCAERIFEYDPGAKIVLISGYDESGPNGIDEKTKALIKGYMSKPVTVADLTSLLGRLCSE